MSKKIIMYGVMQKVDPSKDNVLISERLIGEPERMDIGVMVQRLADKFEKPLRKNERENEDGSTSYDIDPIQKLLADQMAMKQILSLIGSNSIYSDMEFAYWVEARTTN